MSRIIHTCLLITLVLGLTATSWADDKKKAADDGSGPSATGEKKALDEDLPYGEAEPAKTPEPATAKEPAKTPEPAAAKEPAKTPEPATAPSEAAEAPAAPLPSPEQERAKKRYFEGKKHFQEGRFEEAMKAFTESYNLSQEPTLLYNLGITSERLGEVPRAIALYEVYLEEMPYAPDADALRVRVARLKGEPVVAPPPPTTVAVPDEEATAADKRRELPPPDATIKDEKSSVFWPGVAIGIGGLFLAGSAITGISVYKEYNRLDDTCAPNCSEDKRDKVKNMALATDILGAIGAAVAVTGGILWIVDATKNREKKSGSWSASPAALPGGGGLLVEGRF
jgi:tetratricopeptide (TPR) repeat protein